MKAYIENLSIMSSLLEKAELLLYIATSGAAVSAALVEERSVECEPVAKMASHAIFQYNVLSIDDTHNTWTNVIVKMTILRLLAK